MWLAVFLLNLHLQDKQLSKDYQFFNLKAPWDQQLFKSTSINEWMKLSFKGWAQGDWLVLVAPTFSLKVVEKINGKELTSFSYPNMSPAARKDKDPYIEQRAWLGTCLCNVSDAAAANLAAMQCASVPSGRKALEISTPQMKITYFLARCLLAGEVSSGWGSCLAMLVSWMCTDAPYRKLNLTSHTIWPKKVLSALSVVIYIFSWLHNLTL